MEKLIGDDIQEAVSELGTGELHPGSSIRPGVAYHPIPFEFLKDVPFEKDACIGELNILKALESWGGAKVLEIGCANGYFTFNLARLGARVDAYEPDPNAYHLNRLLLDYEYSGSNNPPIQFFNKAIDTSDLSGKYYDFCILLNAHMWLEKAMGDKATRAFMSDLSAHCGAVYFQTAHAESEGMYVIDRLKSGKDIADYLRECGFYHVDAVSSSSEHGGVRYLFRATGLDGTISEDEKTRVCLLQDQSVTKEYLTLDPRLHNAVDNEARALLSLQGSRHTPNLMSITGDVIRMSYAGVPLTQQNLPPDFILQSAEILSELRAAGLQHNDIKPSDLCVKDGTIMLVDFEWATGFNEPLPEEWTSHATIIGEGFKDPNGYNDAYSLLASVGSLIGSEE